MKRGKYLKFHFECLKNGGIPQKGLCFCGMGELFELMHPIVEDIEELKRHDLPCTWWARGGWEYTISEYTPLRQNIVLLMAAMNGEL